jgi:glutamate/tyrosine decarboxylase-like PLP-dependent enzyme
MDDHRIYSWFLGPKAENADFLERLVLEALRDCVFWRRNFHPEDDILITERTKREEDFQDSHARIQQEFLGMLAHLKRDTPFFSPRYIGHMLADQLLPAMAAYFAAMLHNPNNVSQESSPITTEYEMEACGQLARMCGYAQPSWGHLTSGGTIANFEAFWVARNLKWQPFAVRDVARQLGQPVVPVRLPTGETVDLTRIRDPWIVANLDGEEILSLRERLSHALLERHPDRPAAEIRREVDQRMDRVSISGKGLHRFFAELGEESQGWEAPPLPAGVVIVPATAHYSLAKVTEALGIGKEQVELIPVDGSFRMETGALRQILTRCLQDRRPVYAVVAVMGTTEEGAVDPLDEVVGIREEMRPRGLTFSLHADAAWGGYVRSLFFDSQQRPVETPSQIRDLTRSWPEDALFSAYQAMHETDSVTIDPHKLGFIPYPCGTILFRDPRVRNLLTVDAPYIFTGEERPERPFIGKYILEGSKPGAAAAAVWFAHRVVPLNQSGYGLLIGKSFQSAQELAWRVGRELAPEMATRGVLLRLLTDPPNGNIVCFVVNEEGNQSLATMNRINRAIYDLLKFQPGSVLQEHHFILSSTSFHYPQYGRPTSKGTHSMEAHLAALGIASGEFAQVGTIRVLRCTVMAPWLTLSRGGHPDYSIAFAQVLRETISKILPSAIAPDSPPTPPVG